MRREIDFLYEWLCDDRKEDVVFVCEWLYNEFIEERGVVVMSILKEVYSVVCVSDSNEVVKVNSWKKLEESEKFGFKEGRECVVSVEYDEDEGVVNVLNMGEVDKFIKEELLNDDVMEMLKDDVELLDGIEWLKICLKESLIMGCDDSGVYKVVVWDDEYVRGVSLYVKFDMYMDEEMLSEIEKNEDLE